MRMSENQEESQQKKNRKLKSWMKIFYRAFSIVKSI